MEKNIKIKTLDELHKLAIDTSDLEDHIKILVQETEQRIIEGIQTGLNSVAIPISQSDYNLLTYNREDSVKIVTYNLLKILQNNKYKIGLKKIHLGFSVIIDISKRSGSDVIKMLDNYLNNFI